MILLDTHAAVWMDSGLRMGAESRAAIRSAAAAGGILVSSVTAWEIGMLVSKGRLHLNLPPSLWFTNLIDLPGVRMTPLLPAAAIAASYLPEPFHNDPADRLLVATARELRVPMVTRDARILAYADAGHVQAIEC